jgi:D-alanyl-D-alanine carboxypeptidase
LLRRDRTRFQAGKATALAFLLCAITWPSVANELYGAPPRDLSVYLNKLVSAYPSWIAKFDEEFLVLKNGQKLALSDHRTNKSFEEMLEHPDIDDMFYVPYPRGTVPKQPPKNFDPGRVRFEPLFVAMYGDCRRSDVSGNLRTIDWLPAHGGGRVSITGVNGVDQALGAVSRELDKLPDQFMKFIKPTGGTYNCRAVAGSAVRSTHAYGAALDINTKYADYWRWASKTADDLTWKNQIPMEIIRVFEEHGFIWGGYWYHFDTMHFEYRPELL